MTDTQLTTFDEMKKFLQFDDKDAAHLASLQPIVEKYGSKITDGFYSRLALWPETAKYIEGRVESLSQTHLRWMRELVSGVYDEAYFESRRKIGMVHVKIGLPPHWVEAVMSTIRTEMGFAMAEEIRDPAEFAVKHASFVRICDLDLLVINAAYQDDRLRRLSTFTGMKRQLLENIIRMPER